MEVCAGNTLRIGKFNPRKSAIAEDRVVALSA
jgi:hypothetical protein